MDAPTTPPGAFVLEVANLGNEVVASFTKFITTRKVQERRMENVLATVSITTSLLLDLGSTINKHEKDVYIDDDVTRATCKTCKADLEKLLLLSKEASENGMWIREGKLGGNPVTAEIDPWFLFNVGLGGGEKSADFWKRLETTRYSLVALTDSVKYKIYKELKEQNRLDPDQAEEFKSLVALLPQLVKTIERNEQMKKERLAWEAEKAERTERAEKAERALKSSKNRPDVGNKDSLVKPAPENKDSDAASEVTMIEPDLDIKVRRREPLVRIQDDRNSIYSFDSMDENNFLDTKEVFEEWILRWNESRKDVRKSWSVLGLKFKEYYEDPGFWGIDPELRSQDELRVAYENLSANTSPSKYRESIQKTIKGLPDKARESIEGLIEDRQQATSNMQFKRQWSVVAVRPQVKYHFGGESLFKSPKSQDWLIMIKGETLDRSERKRPTRFDDPWRKPYQPFGRGRRYPRAHPRLIEDDYYNRDFERAPIRPPIPIRDRSPIGVIQDRRHRPLMNRDHENGGYRPGTIVVGEVSDMEAAEKKMDEILGDLPNKFTV